MEEQNVASELEGLAPKGAKTMVQDAEMGRQQMIAEARAAQEQWDNENQAGSVRVDVPVGPTLTDLMNLMKQQHLATTSQVSAINERVGHLEDAEQQRRVIKNATHTDTTFDSSIRTMRCEDCNAVFEGRWTFGMSMRCPDCSKPGAVICHCPCGKRFSRQKDGPVRCQQCIDCAICSEKPAEKRSEFVCGVCARKGAAEGIYVCFCGRRAPAGSYMGMCKKCESEHRNQGAAQFPGGDKPESDPLKVAQVEGALDAQRRSIDTSAAGQALPGNAPIFMGDRGWVAR